MVSEIPESICANEKTSTDANLEIKNQSSKPSRSKKKPDRFGEIAGDEFGVDEEKENSFEAMLHEDSLDEYFPDDEEEEEEDGTNEDETIEDEEEINAGKNTNGTKKRRVVHTVRNTKKNKTDDNMLQQNKFWDANFDDEFDQLNGVGNSSLICIATVSTERDDLGDETRNDNNLPEGIIIIISLTFTMKFAILFYSVSI